jgi:hypothetical protein
MSFTISTKHGPVNKTNTATPKKPELSRAERTRLISKLGADAYMQYVRGDMSLDELRKRAHKASTKL